MYKVQSYEFLQSERQQLALMWARIAPDEPTADVTPVERGALEEQWIEIAPHELNSHKASCLEKKGAFELVYDIPNFFAPGDDEQDAFEDSYQRHAASYIIWK
jgi:hypothetical protein